MKKFNAYFKRVRKIIEILEAADAKAGVKKEKGGYEGHVATVRNLKNLSGRLGAQQVTLVALPLIVAVGFSAWTIVSNASSYGAYWGRVKTTASFVASKKGVMYLKNYKTAGAKKIATSLLKDTPFRSRHFIWIIPGYMLSILGAAYLNEFQAFRQNRILKAIFLKRKLVDIDDQPWDVCWTPFAIIVYAYQANPEEIGARDDIWGAVNFVGGTVVVDEHNIQTLVITSQAQIPEKITIVIPNDIFSVYTEAGIKPPKVAIAGGRPAAAAVAATNDSADALDDRTGEDAEDPPEENLEADDELDLADDPSSEDPPDEEPA